MKVEWLSAKAQVRNRKDEVRSQDQTQRPVHVFRIRALCTGIGNIRIQNKSAKRFHYHHQENMISRSAHSISSSCIKEMTTTSEAENCWFCYFCSSSKHGLFCSTVTEESILAVITVWATNLTQVPNTIHI